eukprot:1154493-Prorocentrum_minimum.AAC.1
MSDIEKVKCVTCLTPTPDILLTCQIIVHCIRDSSCHCQPYLHPHSQERQKVILSHLPSLENVKQLRAHLPFSAFGRYVTSCAFVMLRMEAPSSLYCPWIVTWIARVHIDRICPLPSLDWSTSTEYAPSPHPIGPHVCNQPTGRTGPRNYTHPLSATLSATLSASPESTSPVLPLGSLHSTAPHETSSTPA